VWEHRRSLAVQSVAVAIYDEPTPEAAVAAFRTEIARMLGLNFGNG